MSRTRLSLYEVDRVALASFGAELGGALARDDRDALAGMLKLEGAAAEVVKAASKAVFVFLASPSFPPSAPVLDSLRLAAKARALRLSWTSESLALEGRLRAFEPLRADPELARRIDSLLDGAGVPWFLKTPGGSFGILSRADREQLAGGLEGLRAPEEELTPELVAFADALGALEGDVLCHDTL